MLESLNERFVEPQIVASHFHIRPGETVADYGAGTGHFIPSLAAATGAKGIVYACDIQKNLVETLGANARAAHHDNVRPLWGDLEVLQGTKIPEGEVEVGLLVNTLFQLEDKEVAVAEISRTLKKGARLYVIDWSESFGGLGPQPQDVYDEKSTRALFETAGFIFERSFPAGSHHYGIMFRKP